MRSLYTGGLYRQVKITMRIALLGPEKGGLYRQVIFICRWSFKQMIRTMS